ncbi:MAG: relaxase/mobilization nuclease domain-containing protein [Clostridia bacterium]|nr:relaxase/mobilization nuclease domain-containing protein [Clostridia bacterium]
MAIIKCKPIKSTIKKAIDYITDDAKTSEQTFTYGEGVAVGMASAQFEKVREEWTTKNNSHSKKDNEILGYHIVQSFDVKDKISEDEALQIGIEFANKIFKGNYQFVVATHNDKNHIHNHIIVNAFSNKGERKYRTIPYKTIKEYQKLNDELCISHGLSVLKNDTKKKGKDISEIYATREGRSYKKILQMEIDYNINKSNSFEEFIELMKIKYEIKFGKYIAFRRKNTQERFTRAKTIGDDYSEERIKERILSKDKSKDNFEIRSVFRKDSDRYNQLRKAVSDIKKFDKMFDLLNKENISSLDDLNAKIKILEEERNDKKYIVKKNDKKIDMLNELITKMKQYNDNKDIYLKYKKNINKYTYEKYTTEILLAENAKKYIESFNMSPDTDISLIIKKLDDIMLENEKYKKEVTMSDDSIKELIELRKLVNDLGLSNDKTNSKDKNKDIER